MTLIELRQFIKFLQKRGFEIFGPQPENKKIVLERISRVKKMTIAAAPSLYFPKFFFFLGKENLFKYDFRPKIRRILKPSPKIALVGVNFLDLKAILLYDLVFEKDSYYQNRRKNILVIGHSLLPPPQNNIFKEKYSREKLAHLKFDIFFEVLSSQKFLTFVGSPLGKNLLNSFGYKNYQFISFSGPPKQNHKKIIEKFTTLSNSIWSKLGKLCLECGKCSFFCPTCFCFRIDDEPDFDGGTKTRYLDSCFYQDFSEVAGNFKFLKGADQKLRFFYYHKFVRIPKEYGILGCIGCNRCSQVCPAKIKISEILKSIKN